MLDYLTKPIDWFSQFGDMLDTPGGPLVYRDNGANVLGVAHLDTVMARAPRFCKGGRVVVCPQLDDRLGAWALLKELPRLGVSVDILLTDGEESGNSTAQYFTPPKKYNWIFSFDRAGSDVVLYEYETPKRKALLRDYGFRVGWGSFSDICWLNHLGVTGFNFGIGYHNQHTPKCYAKLRTTNRQASRFACFWHDLKNTALPWSEHTRGRRRRLSAWSDTLRDIGGYDNRREYRFHDSPDSLWEECSRPRDEWDDFVWDE